MGKAERSLRRRSQAQVPVDPMANLDDEMRAAMNEPADLAALLGASQAQLAQTQKALGLALQKMKQKDARIAQLQDAVNRAMQQLETDRQTIAGYEKKGGPGDGERKVVRMQKAG